MYAASGPVDLEWVVGKARGEIPWFGLLKLWSTGSLGSPSPDNSVRNLWASLAIIVATPIIIDISLTYREKREISKKRTAELLEKESAESEKEKKVEAEVLDKTPDQPPTRP